MDAPPPSPRRAAPRRRAPLALAVAGTAAVLSGILLSGDPGPATSSAPVSSPPGSAAPSTATGTAGPVASGAADAEGTAGGRPPAAPPVRMVVEDAAVDVAVLPLTPSAEENAAQLLVPPETLDGYWLTPYGMPGEGSQNTTYITGHSWEDREAPFNRLSDPGLVGSEIELRTGTGTVEYVVDSVVTHDKDTLKDSEIWHVVPDRLVVVSCYAQDLWGKNVVLTASPVPPAS
ncbi:class F sortase [Kocuria sp. M1R5S2]|uniref:class F sortase n=1 Tax=Kocuria rhizosphaerae TaxID=3376285 RepID=UPI0037A43C34